MPAKKRGKKGGGADRLGALPDELLQHILSFLPADEAVRTCVLAHRWRHLWKSVPSLRIGDGDLSDSVTKLRRFVDRLFRLRGGSPLDKCELIIGGFSERGDERRVNRWFRRAVACKARVLKLDALNNYVDPFFLLDDLPLVSKHLTRLELCSVRCHTRFLDFSSCPALEHLEFELCDFRLATAISSESLKSLTIYNSFFPKKLQLRIYAPNLVSLRLEYYTARNPILESMPLLAEAFVEVTGDYDGELHVGSQDSDVCKSGCALLKGLSEARKLELISIP